MAAGAVVVLTAFGPVAGAQEPAPRSSATVQLSSTRVDKGDWITVRGEGFPAGALILVEVCGTNDIPALGCDDQTAVDAAVDRNGLFEVPLLVEEPLSPCPCTVRASNKAEDVATSTPIEITGVGPNGGSGSTGATGGVALVPDVSVGEVDLVGNDSWTTWFGASPARTFRYTVRNDGPGTADGLVVDLRGGHGKVPDEVLHAPAVGTLGPGEERTFEVPVDLGPFAAGSYRVVGRLTAAGDDGGGPTPTQHFGATTTSFPWMVVVIPVVVLLEVLLLLSRNRLRDRVQRHAEVAAAAPVVASAVVARVERTRAAGVDTQLLADRVVREVERSGGAPGSTPGPGPRPIRGSRSSRTSRHRWTSRTWRPGNRSGPDHREDDPGPSGQSTARTSSWGARIDR
ncbi:hypothetical protein ACE2AJ_19895 [Aquihabitans daechungensis]|uniref:hypothetical protein n=1 Tax=Aquihabitans daechungensis TaxID=1052257 RepID=UPI003B9E0145